MTRTPARQRVVVTGMGVVSPLGTGVPATWSGLVEGRSGIVASTDESGQTRIAGQVVDFDADEILGWRTARQHDRFTQFALVAAREARVMAGLAETGGDAQVEAVRSATVVGTGLGGIGSHQRAVRALCAGRRSVSAYTAVAMVPSAASAAVAIESGARGPALTPATACASGTDAVGVAADLIRAGRADLVLAGAADAPLGPAMFSAFAAMGAAAVADGDPGAGCRPFAADRTGLVPGEGAAVLVLESASHARGRGAVALAEILGYGASNDAYHLSAPAPDGATALVAVRAALSDAGLDPEALGYICAHGTGTVLNDRMEAGLFADLVGQSVAVSSIKSMTGHLMGASGAVETVACIQALRTGIVPGTRNCARPAPDCAGIDLVCGSARPVDASAALNVNFGFGGHNAALVLGRV